LELSKIKSKLKAAIEDGLPGLPVCGGYQCLGRKYITPDGTALDGLNILDFYTESKKNRLTGDIVIAGNTFGTVVGLEIHGGRTSHNYGTLGEVPHTFGNNDDDAKERIHYKNLLGTYLHGPILPKNHEITDYLLEKACERKGLVFEPKELDNSEEEAAKKVIVERVAQQK